MNNAELLVAESMENSTVEKIRVGFETKLGRKIDFTVKRDASLIGGFVAYIDSRVYDCSMKTKLESLRRALGN